MVACTLSSSTCTGSGRVSRAVIHGRRSTPNVRARAKFIEDDDDMEAAVAQFLAQQDMSERGAPGSVDPDRIIGGEEVDEETAKSLCRDVLRVVRLLKESRDMDFNEVKLIVQVDDPRNDDIRRMGMEDSAGVSRDEMAIALQQIADGQIPKDRIALKVLHAEISKWPFLESGTNPEKPKSLEANSLGGLLEANAVASGLATPERRGFGATVTQPGEKTKGRDPKDRPQGLEDTLPEWMGYGAIYLVTIIPVIIFSATIALLFFSSLK